MRGCDLEQLDAAFEVTVVGRVSTVRALLSKGQILGLVTALFTTEMCESLC